MFDCHFHRTSFSSRAGLMVRRASVARSGPQASAPLPFLGLPSQGYPAQEVVGHRYQEHHRGDFGQPP
jgi:hypothetical protein